MATKKPTPAASTSLGAPAAPTANAASAARTTEIDPSQTALAWQRHEAAIRALPRESLQNASLDVTQAAELAIAATANLLSRREALTALYRDPPIARFEALADVARATQHADLLHRIAVDRTAAFADLFPRMTELRGLLLDDMDLQVRRKRCDEKLLAEIRKGDRDAADFANDLNDAADWYAKNLATLPRTTVTAEEVNEARELAAKALARLAARHLVDAQKTDAVGTSELRARAFTLLAREYDEVQRLGAPIFWREPDGWEAFLPSLWTVRAAPEPAKPKTAEPVKPPQG